MDTHPTVRLLAKHRLCYPNCKAICGNVSSQVTMKPSLLVANTKQIHLIQNQTNKKCLELARRGSIEVPYHQYQDVLLKCSQMFAIQVSVDLTHLAMNIMLSSDQDSLTILDENFTISDVLKVFQIAFDHLSNKISGKINRKLKRYIKNTKRNAEDKKILDLMYEAQKSNQIQKDEQNNSCLSQKRQKKYERPKDEQNRKKQFNDEQRNKQKRDNWRGNRNNNRNSREQQNWNKKSQEKYYRRPSKQKQIDKRILLGINGDSEDGWRQRYRPQRIPEGYEIQIKQEDKKTEEKKSNIEAKRVPQKMQTQQVRKEINMSSALKSTFSFPRSGKKFDFSKLKNFMLFVNGSFWIKYLDGTLSISKGQESFARKCDLTFIDDNGFMGEGLTLNLDGMSNLQDGGQTFGDAKISTFTLSESQFFHVVTMEVYPLTYS